MKKILILGATGMIGSALFKYLTAEKKFSIFGTYHSTDPKFYFGSNIPESVLSYLDATKVDPLKRLLSEIQPDIVINCIGVVKQGLQSSDTMRAIELNALLPHRLNKLCNEFCARFIQISTDCVFNGNRGHYSELDIPDAIDVYGQTKILGERLDGNCTIIRTSCVGPELRHPKKGLLEWFLAQRGEVKGYVDAIFSGITTYELGKVLSQYFFGVSKMHGLWNLSSSPIDKFSLLEIFRDTYLHNVEIIIDRSLKVDRSLNSEKFKLMSGYNSPDWSTMLLEAKIFESTYSAN